MRYVETPLPGAWVLELEGSAMSAVGSHVPSTRDEFAARGMNPRVAQCNASFNARQGTLRGMHYQADPHGESKLVRCVRGRIFDVAVDLRADSPTIGTGMESS